MRLAPETPSARPAAASEPRNRHVMPESHKHPQERLITNRSGQQYPGGIAAGGRGLGKAKDIMQGKKIEMYSGGNQFDMLYLCNL